MQPVFSFFRRLFLRDRPAPRRARRRPARTLIAAPPPTAPSGESPQAYLARVNGKIHTLAEEFAAGKINRVQFQELFEHYQRERGAVQTWVGAQAPSGDWRQSVDEGRSMVIRSLHSARALGYAVFANDSGIPLNTIGRFDIDPALAVPMLSAYRSATREIFGSEVRSTQIEGGQWLTFIPGDFTTLLAIFTTEPAGRQIEILEDLHRVFEQANRTLLARPRYAPGDLVFPHQSFLGRLD